MTLISEIASGNRPLYDIEFSLGCFNTESRLWVLFQFLPEMKNFRYTRTAMDDEEFREIENMIQSVGVEMRNLVKVPHLDDTAPKSREEPEEDLTESEMLGRLLDEVLCAREDLHALHAQGRTSEDEQMENRGKDYTNSVDALSVFLRGVKDE